MKNKPQELQKLELNLKSAEIAARDAQTRVQRLKANLAAETRKYYSK